MPSLDSSDLEDLFVNFTFNNTYFDFDPSTSPCLDLVIGINSKVLVSLYSLVFILSLVGNTIVVLVVRYRQQTISPTDVYLVNLAFADLILALTVPFWAVYGSSEWIFSDSVSQTLQQLNFYSGILLLVCIRVDTITLMNYRVVCALVWLVAIYLSLSNLLYQKVFPMSLGDILYCPENVGHEDIEMWQVPVCIFRPAVNFFVPLVILFFDLFLNNCFRKQAQTSQAENNQKKHLIFAVLLVFIIAWCPYNLVNLVDTLMMLHIINETCSVRVHIDAALLITGILCFLHCCINPILYTIIWKKFRQDLFRILMRTGFRREQVSESFSLGDISPTRN
ncbi:CXCR1 protein, partial [Polyodon spathula]|nr:C-X-C chemokine receptor type 1-like [Polyodon spathula]MBN3271003.1 CXCR1 protein [Polyodon spathula]